MKSMIHSFHVNTRVTTFFFSMPLLDISSFYIELHDSLTKVFMGRHPADFLEGDDRQQTGAYEGANPGEEEEEPHDGALHGLGGSRISKLQTCITEKKEK